MKSAGSRRWAVGAGLAFGAVLIGYLLLAHGPHASFWPKCLFHQYTGLHCAGCGMTRAAHACLQGDLALAFRHNPVVMSLLLLGLLAAGWELLARWSGKPLPLRPRFSVRGLCWIVALLLIFWVLRNIPAWPFTLLAPP